MKGLSLFAALAFGVVAHAADAPLPALVKTDPLTWTRALVDRFGCFLEKQFGSRDARFNCGLKNYVNKGDPCEKTDVYNEGPGFPAAKAATINPLVRSVDLSWEHGELQQVALTLTKKMPADEVRKIFALPKKNDERRDNVMSVDVQDCGKNATCVVIQGFDHVGAGDACGGGD
jgi:hypothetical protein